MRDLGQLIKDIRSVHTDESDSLLSAAYRHVRWNMRVKTRQLVFPILNRWPNLYGVYYYPRKWLFSNHFTDADPLKIIYVDPDEIDFACDHYFGRPLPRGAVYGNEWDREVEQFMERDVPQAIEAYFADDLNKDDQLYPHIDQLATSLEEQGYLTQTELQKRNRKKAQSKNNDPVPTRFNEITVNIGRNGQLLWSTYGQHRLAMAKLLDIDQVPVMVCVRHKKWQNIRDEIRMVDQSHQNQNRIKQLKTHPDMQDII